MVLHKKIFSTVIILAILFLLLAYIEVILRIRGELPEGRQIEDNPTMRQSDPVIGWKNTPGNYLWSLKESAGNIIKTTIWEDGARATQAKRTTRPHSRGGVSWSIG